MGKTDITIKVARSVIGSFNVNQEKSLHGAKYALVNFTMSNGKLTVECSALYNRYDLNKCSLYKSRIYDISSILCDGLNSEGAMAKLVSTYNEVKGIEETRSVLFRLKDSINVVESLTVNGIRINTSEVRG